MKIFKKALPVWSAFFIFWSFPVLAGCPLFHAAEKVAVEHVYDGDTVRLADGRRIRLIGINAPETAKKTQPGEHLAEESAAELGGLLKRGQVSLLLGEESQDRYQRWLGYLFVDGQLVAETLLLKGLAFHVAIPPNLRFSRCLKEAEQQAGRNGVWAEYSDIRKPVLALANAESGFRVLDGRISDVRKIRRGYLLEVDGRLAVRINTQVAEAISARDPLHWKGALIQVRGWVKAKSAHAPAHYKPWFLVVSHPMHLEMH